MVEATIRMVNPNVPVTTVWASRGKIVRAEPVAALYEQNRIHHVGTFATLEDQMCGFTSDFDRTIAGYSPDKVDALVWALTDLFVEPMAHSGIFELYREQARQLAATNVKPAAPAVDYGIKSSDDGFEIVWKTANTAPTTDEVETEIAKASAEQPAAASLAEAASQPAPPSATEPEMAKAAPA